MLLEIPVMQLTNVLGSLATPDSCMPMQLRTFATIYLLATKDKGLSLGLC